MWRKTLLPFAVLTALALSAPAGAQEASASRPPTYSDSRMQDFARATVDLQALGSQDPAAMTRAIEGAGMSVEDYNRMGDAMRADPALAASLNPYLEEANAARRSSRAQPQRADRGWTPAPRHAASAKKAATRHAHGKAHPKSHKAHKAHKAHKVATHVHHAAKRTRHAATTPHRSHHRHRKG